MATLGVKRAIFLALLCACNRDSAMTPAERDSLNFVHDFQTAGSRPYTEHIWVWIPAAKTPLKARNTGIPWTTC